MYPVTANDPPTATPTLQNPLYHSRTFQVAPKVEDCDPTVPNSPDPNGIHLAFLDGSVRFVTPAIAEGVFWGLVTPAGGENAAAP